MARQDRIGLIQGIEAARASKVIVYLCGDRPLASAQLADDAIRPLYEHLRALGKFPSTPKKIDLILYALGGVMETPWKIVTMFREFCDEFHVLVPYKAYSGATLIALGADTISMTDKGELSPIDPALQLAPTGDRPLPFLLPDLGVEDIASYVNFLRNRAGLTDQSALAGPISTLSQMLTPPLLGRIERIYSHIRLVARKLLALCKPPLDDPRVTRIVEALTEKTYVHGHGIGRREAKDLGLQVELLDGPIKDLLWSLVVDYEEEMRLRTTSDPQGYFTDDGPDAYTEENAITAVIESQALFDCFMGRFRLARIRKIPPQPVININLGLNLPPGLQSQELPATIQQAVQQMLQQAAQQLQQLVAQEIARQSPVERITGGLIGGRWQRGDS